MNAVPPSAGKLYLVVGYDGSAPAVRALEAAVNLLRDREAVMPQNPLANAIAASSEMAVFMATT